VTAGKETQEASGRPTRDTMRKMKDMPLQDRPREKIAKRGAAALSDNELIEAIIGRGTRTKDVRMISQEICGILRDRRQGIRYEDLCAIEGIGPGKASQILACFEMGRRYFETAPADRVTKPEDILPLVAHLRDKRQEHFTCITLNGAGEVLGNRVITDRAASVICVHNHPSGSLEPSSQDIAITTQLKEAGSLIGIQLVDHVIVT